MSKFRVLLIGLGQIGCGYDAAFPYLPDQPRSSSYTLTHARALACHPGFVLEAGVDLDSTARHNFTQLYDAPAYVDLSEWCAASKNLTPDLVVMAVGPHIQTSLVQELLQHCVPQVLLLEKPIASDLEQGRVLKYCCQQHPQMKVAVNYIRRWLPSVQHWRNRLDARELGQFLHGYLTYGKGLLSNGSHFVNLAEAWLGPLTLGRVIDLSQPFQGFDREVNLDLFAANHAHASLHLRSVGPAGLRAGALELWFERGCLSWLNHGQSIAFWPRRSASSGESHYHLSDDPELFSTGLNHYQLEVVDALYRHFLDPEAFPLLCDLNSGFCTLELLAPACKGNLHPPNTQPHVTE